MGLDVAACEPCGSSGTSQATVPQDVEESTRAGVSGTPADNAPYHTETFPNHKHTLHSAVGETVMAAHPPTIEALLEKIVGLEAKGKR